MRQTKFGRALALGLTCAVVLSCGVSAAFTDQKEIAHSAAVEELTTLHILDGRDDGSFDPGGAVSRAEMAKMIYCVINGGPPSEEKTAQIAALDPSAYTFTDTPSHWAAWFIQACTDKKIIAGRGDGSFAPNDAVTGYEAAKMLLICIGYDPAVEELTGEGWADATLKLAQNCALLDGLDGIDLAQPLTRDAAAQMVYNALYAPMVTYEIVGIVDGTGQMLLVEVSPATTMYDRYFALGQ